MNRYICFGCLILGLVAFSFHPAYGQNLDYTMMVDGSAGLPGGTATLTVSLNHQSTAELSGWSVAVCHAEGIEILGITSGATTLVVNQGSTPDFLVQQPYSAEGWTGGAVISFFGNDTMSPGMGYELHVAAYQLSQSGSFAVWRCSLGNIQTKVVEVGSISYVPVTLETTIEVLSGGTASFVRGDCNSDGEVALNDGLSLLNVLFGDQEFGFCPESCNMNGDSSFAVNDVILLLTFLFGGGADLPAPFPNCGSAAGAVCLTSNCP